MSEKLEWIFGSFTQEQQPQCSLNHVSLTHTHSSTHGHTHSHTHALTHTHTHAHTVTPALETIVMFSSFGFTGTSYSTTKPNRTKCQKSNYFDVVLYIDLVMAHAHATHTHMHTNTLTHTQTSIQTNKHKPKKKKIRENVNIPKALLLFMNLLKK